MPLLFKFAFNLSFIILFERRDIVSYAKWETRENMFQRVVQINEKSIIEKGGIPIMYDDNNLYLNNDEAHSLIIGTTGSGKTQATILPLMKLSMLAGESIVINDVNGDIYERTANIFKANGYNVLVLNFDNPKYGDSWNPLVLPYQLYQEGDKDKSLKIVEDLGYYLFTDTKESLDPFWTNTAIDYFSGLVLYLFEKAKKEQINLKSVFSLATSLQNEENAKKFLTEIGKNNSIYYNVSGTLETAYDTRAGIISTFTQKLKVYNSREILANMMLKSNFNITNISNEKTIVYIISGLTSYSNSLIPLFVNQVFEANKIYNNKKILNIILDDFYNMLPLKDVYNLFNYSRSIYIRFTVVIRSFNDLLNVYGKENTEIIKMCFGKIIYLLSNDIYTLEEISKLCGNQEKDGQVVPLITVEELKYLDKFEAIFLIPRIMPFKTKLVPDYQIKWPFKETTAKLELREENSLDIFEY